MKRPESLTVLGRTVRLRWRAATAMPGAVGEWDAARGRIDIARGQRALDEADTVLHELMHAILHHQGRENGGDAEEAYVRALATGTLIALRENPALAAWLLRPLAA